MNVAILINARTGSQRLKGKHFLKILGDLSALDVLCLRLQNLVTVPNCTICVATTVQENDAVFRHQVPAGVRVFQGAVENIPFRHLQASEKLNADLIISVDGDDILSSPEAINLLFAAYDCAEDKNQFFSSVGLPLGMNVSGYSAKFLKSVLGTSSEKKLETGWGRLFPVDKKKLVALNLGLFPEDLTRFTLDYSQDLAFFQAIGQHFGTRILTANSREMIAYVVQNELYKINDQVVEKFWENFHREQELEKC